MKHSDLLWLNEEGRIARAPRSKAMASDVPHNIIIYDVARPFPHVCHTFIGTGSYFRAIAYVYRIKIDIAEQIAKFPLAETCSRDR